MRIQTVGVVGAGLMGCGVAQALAQSDHKVILCDLSDDILEKAKQEIINNARMQILLKGGEKSKGIQTIVDHVHLTTEYQDLKEADFIIENVTEKWEVKEEVFRMLDKLCEEECIFASNTSAIPISRLASVTERPQKFVGIHFMNPVALKSVVEVIPGRHTIQETIEHTKQLLAQMGKEAVVVGDSPGFVSNRVLMLMVNEAIFLLHEGVSTAKNIDKIFKGCFGHKMGPLETADLIGLDTVLYSLEVLYDNLKDSKFRPCPLLKEMVGSGLYGRKSGKGFYDYERS